METVRVLGILLLASVLATPAIGYAQPDAAAAADESWDDEDWEVDDAPSSAVPAPNAEAADVDDVAAVVEPWYQSTWFWTVVGSVVAASSGAVLLMVDGPAGR